MLGDSRLWIQRALPKKPRKATQKPRGRPKAVKKPEPKVPSTPGPSRTRPARGTPVNGNNPLKRPAPDDGRRSSKRTKSTTTSIKTGSSGRPSRAAADNANRRLAALPQTTMRSPRGTRTSTRLRGAEDEELWQEIPEEWLRGPDSSSSPGRLSSEEPSPRAGGKSPALATSDAEMSELTELSDDEDDDDKKSLADEEEAQNEVNGDEEEDNQQEEAPEPKSDNEKLPSDFVEWETVSFSKTSSTQLERPLLSSVSRSTIGRLSPPDSNRARIIARSPSTNSSCVKGAREISSSKP